jgi:hypothetical protein
MLTFVRTRPILPAYVEGGCDREVAMEFNVAEIVFGVEKP